MIVCIMRTSHGFSCAYAGLGVAYFYQDKRDEARKAFDLSVRKHLVAGRRDLAIKVKQESDALFGTQR